MGVTTYMGLNVYDMTLVEGGGGGGGGGVGYMGLNVHVMGKCICNRDNLMIKEPHVQCMNMHI
jgi:hypothetical protein